VDLSLCRFFPNIGQKQRANTDVAVFRSPEHTTRNNVSRLAKFFSHSDSNKPLLKRKAKLPAFLVARDDGVESVKLRIVAKMTALAHRAQVGAPVVARVVVQVRRGQNDHAKEMLRFAFVAFFAAATDVLEATAAIALAPVLRANQDFLADLRPVSGIEGFIFDRHIICVRGNLFQSDQSQGNHRTGCSFCHGPILP